MASAPPEVTPPRPDGHGWALGDEGAAIPPDAPLHALLAVTARTVGAFFAQAAQGTGLSPAGLGVLRLLVERDGLKSSEVAARGWCTPGTVTSVADTLVRDGYVERRRDEADRRVVRLFVTEAGRRKCDEVVTAVAPRLSSSLAYVDPGDEPVIRKFLAETITRFGGLTQEERK